MNKNDIMACLKNIEAFLKELIEITKSILNLIWKNKVIMLVIVIFYSVYLSINYIAYEMPKTTITKYYSFIDEKKLDDAWAMLAPQCQVRWKEGKKDFKNGYETFATTNIINIENFNTGNLFESLLSSKKQLIVDIIVVENFKWHNIIDTLTGQERSDQKENSFWLRLKHKELSLNRLKYDSLPAYRNALKLVRRYRKVFTIEKNPNINFFNRLLSNNWLIVDLDNKEIGIIFDTTFYYK